MLQIRKIVVDYINAYNVVYIFIPSQILINKTNIINYSLSHLSIFVFFDNYKKML